MKKSVLMFSLLSGTALMLPDLAVASGIFSTHKSTPQPEPASSLIDMSRSYKTAGICFLGAGDCGDARFSSLEGDDDYKVDTVQQCGNEGYSVTSCSLPAYPSGQCPYNSAYFAKCVEDRPRACKEAGFTETSCASGTVVEATCSFDANYKKCKCDPCSGYDYTYAQATAQGYVPDGSCLSCSETKYKRKENPCSGYSSCECGGETGSASCYSGSIQKFESCKPCCSDICSSGWKTVTCPSSASKHQKATTECGSACYVCQEYISGSVTSQPFGTGGLDGYYKAQTRSEQCPGCAWTDPAKYNEKLCTCYYLSYTPCYSLCDNESYVVSDYSECPGVCPNTIVSNYFCNSEVTPLDAY